MHSNFIQHFEENINGKDFIVGDIHGHYDELITQLEKMHFDFDNDRLFSVGDLIDRGSKNLETLKLLDKKWFFAVRGNHEQMIIDRYEHPENKPAWSNTVKTREDAVRVHVANGGKWFDELATDEERIHVYETIKKLPYVVTFNVGVKLFSIVHAEVPDGFDDWASFVSALKTTKLVRHAVLYGRNEILRYWDYVSDEPIEDEYSMPQRFIRGIDIIIHGHTSTSMRVYGGNQIWIDTLSKSGVLTVLVANEFKL